MIAPTQTTIVSRAATTANPYQRAPEINVGLWDRWLSLAAGTVLGTKGIFKRWPGGLLWAIGGGYLVYRGWTGRCSAYRAMGIPSIPQPTVDICQQATVRRSPDEVYRFWRDFQNLPRFIKYLAEVTPAGDAGAHWVVRLPGGFEMAWDTAVVADRAGVEFVCELLPGQGAEARGEVQFTKALGDRGTEVRVSSERQPDRRHGRLGASRVRFPAVEARPAAFSTGDRGTASPRAAGCGRPRRRSLRRVVSGQRPAGLDLDTQRQPTR